MQEMYQIILWPSDLRTVLAFVLEKDIQCRLLTSIRNFSLLFVLETENWSAALDICMGCSEKNIEFEIKYRASTGDFSVF